MHIPTHLMLSWVVGHRLKARSDRRAVAWAGVAADLDGLSILAGVDAYGRWHHVLTHGLMAGLLIALVAASCARNRLQVWWLSLGAFHLHLLCDFLGSGLDWPIQYFWPFSDTFYHTPYGWNWTPGRIGPPPSRCCLSADVSRFAPAIPLPKPSFPQPLIKRWWRRSERGLPYLRFPPSFGHDSETDEPSAFR